MKKIIIVTVALVVVAQAQALKLAAGAGYKKPLMDIITEYEKGGKKIDPFFGNMRQVTTQASQTDIALIVGDKNFLSKKSGLHSKLKDKLYIVATVPQSMTYVITGEVDAGIVNLTAALANQDKIGGYIEVDQQYYSSIDIVAGALPACNDEKCKDFLEFLHSPTAINIFKKYGL